MKVFCVLVCLALAVQARPQVKPQIAADPADAFTHGKPPTVHGDPIGAIGGSTKPAPVIEVVAAPAEERTDETTTVVPELAESSSNVKAAAEVDPKPVLTTGGKDPLPVPAENKPATATKPATPTKPDSSEEDGSAEEAGRKRRQAPVAVAKGKKSEESSEESSEEQTTTTASVKAAEVEKVEEKETVKPIKKIN